MGGSLEEEEEEEEEEGGSESERQARFRVGKPNLGERRGGRPVVRRWTAIYCNEIGELQKEDPEEVTYTQ